MTRNKGYKRTDEQRKRLSEAHIGQIAWNKGNGGCKKGHDDSLYVEMPSGIKCCLGCKKENGKKYREKNRNDINLKNRVKRYNMQADDLSNMWIKQKGCCAICKNELSETLFRIDHNHTTGKVRGLLCASCNTGIGLLKDSSKVCISAANYLIENDE